MRISKSAAGCGGLAVQHVECACLSACPRVPAARRPSVGLGETCAWRARPKISLRDFLSAFWAQIARNFRFSDHHSSRIETIIFQTIKHKLRLTWCKTEESRQKVQELNVSKLRVARANRTSFAGQMAPKAVQIVQNFHFREPPKFIPGHHPTLGMTYDGFAAAQLKDTSGQWYTYQGTTPLL